MKPLVLTCDNRTERILLHALCLTRRPRHWRWHWAGIVREFQPAAGCAGTHNRLLQPLAVGLFLGVLGLLLLSSESIAQPLSTTSISFQSALYAANGQPLPNGHYNLAFKFYDVPAGGTSLATSTVSNVLVADGRVSTQFSASASWFSGQNRWLGITVAGQNGGQELAPRVLVTAVPYAMRAASVGDDAGNLHGSLGIVSGGVIADGPTPGEFAYSGGYLEGSWPNWNGTGRAASFRRLIGAFDRSAGFGVASGQDIVSPVIWMYDVPGNLFEVRKVGFGKTVPEGDGIFTVYANNIVEVNGTTRTTVLQITSDRNAKTGYQSVDNRAILEKVAALSILTWVYTNAPQIRHIGPTAQDFSGKFAVGEDDKHIATVDADGVALAAIQGLNQKLEEQLRAKDAEIAALKTEFSARFDELRERLAALDSTLAGAASESAAKKQISPGELPVTVPGLSF